jgi:hypothetical protein
MRSENVVVRGDCGVGIDNDAMEVESNKHNVARSCNAMWNGKMQMVAQEGGKMKER